MRTRSITSVVAVVSLLLAACGGDGGDALSEDDFLNSLTDLCSDVQRDLERLDPPADPADASTFADDALAVYNDAIAKLQDISAPDSLSKDYGDFLDNIEDQIKRFEDLSDAKGSDEVTNAFDKLLALVDEQSQIARDLDAPDCDPNDGDDTTTTVAETAPATTPLTTPPTAPPITLPITVAPVTTPETVPATEQPAATKFTVVDLTTIFIAPDGFYLVPTTPTDATLELIASKPELNEKLLEIGVATLMDSSDNTAVADIWVGVSRTDSMPADWKTLDCPDGGDLRTSANGLPGIICFGAADSPVWEIFTATVNDVGISVYTLVSDVPGDLVADAFLAANP